MGDYIRLRGKDTDPGTLYGPLSWGDERTRRHPPPEAPAQQDGSAQHPLAGVADRCGADYCLPAALFQQARMGPGRDYGLHHDDRDDGPAGDALPATSLQRRGQQHTARCLPGLAGILP